MNIDPSRDMVMGDKPVTAPHIFETFGYSYGAVHKILQIELQVIQCVASWVPRMFAAVNRSVSKLTIALTSAADCGFEILLDFLFARNNICGLLFISETGI